jgi:hypothetical protein
LVEHLPRKLEALTSNSVPLKIKIPHVRHKTLKAREVAAHRFQKQMLRVTDTICR